MSLFSYVYWCSHLFMFCVMFVFFCVLVSVMLIDWFILSLVILWSACLRLFPGPPNLFFFFFLIKCPFVCNHHLLFFPDHSKLLLLLLLLSVCQYMYDGKMLWASTPHQQQHPHHICVAFLVLRLRQSTHHNVLISFFFWYGFYFGNVQHTVVLSCR